MKDFSSDQIKQGIPIKKRGCNFSEGDREQLRGLHDGSILYADACIGVLLAKLEGLGLVENTLIIVGAGHGDALGEDGTTWGHESAEDQVLRVPLIMAGPGLPRGVRVAALTENADIVPTLIDLLGLETDARTDGKSLAPLLRDPNVGPLHRYVFSKYAPSGYSWEPAYIIRDTRYKYEFTRDRSVEHLWRVPDDVGKRVDCLQEAPAAAAAMQRYVRDHLAPLWEEYGSIQFPRSEVVLARFPSSRIKPNPESREAYVFQRDESLDFDPDTDNRWLYHDGVLTSCGWQEDAPPFAFTMQVANGLYLVQLELYSRSDYQGHPASAILVKAGEDTEFKLLREDSGPADRGEWVFADVGEYAVRDGFLNVALDEADQEHWTMLRGLRLLLLSDDVMSAEERQEREEQLRALGYLD